MDTQAESLAPQPGPPGTDVAVIIAAHNSERTLGRAIRSALAEPEVREVVVVDDASTDNTADIARAADDGSHRLKVFSLPVNAGPSVARNRGIAETRSPWLAVLDADDFLLPGRFKGLLDHSQDADLVADDLWQVTEDTSADRSKTLLGHSVKSPQAVDFRDFVLANISSPHRKRGELGFVKPLMRRNFLDQHNIRYQEQMRLGEDYELYARALALGARFRLLPPQGYVSVCRPDSLSGRHSELDLMHLRDSDLTLAEIASLNDADKEALRQHYLGIDCRLQWRLIINAVKASDFSGFVAAFFRPWPVPLYIVEQLFGQIFTRIGRKLGLVRTPEC